VNHFSQQSAQAAQRVIDGVSNQLTSANQILGNIGNIVKDTQQAVAGSAENKVAGEELMAVLAPIANL